MNMLNIFPNNTVLDKEKSAATSKNISFDAIINLNIPHDTQVQIKLDLFIVKI